MNLKPASVAELKTLLAAANGRQEKIVSFDLSALGRLIEHKAEDMTATAEAGITLAKFQKHLAERGQWVPIDPPNPERLSLGALLATDPSGPRRFGFGTIRDYVIGLQAVLADGRIIHSGGKVVKNVAGYDLMKLFIGSRGSLGVIVEATFKLRPLPETEQFVEAKCASLNLAGELIEAVLNSDLSPAVLDLHNVSSTRRGLTLVIGFAGTRQEVESQLAIAAQLGFVDRSSLEYEKTMASANPPFRKKSVLPSKTIDLIRALNDASFVARAGNGVICYSGPSIPNHLERPARLEKRLKTEFDPKNILPLLPL